MKVVTKSSTPRPYFKSQIMAKAYAKGKDKLALFMDMRLGKSRVVIDCFRHCKKILIVAPLSGLYEWQKELNIEQEYDYTLVHGNNSKRIRSILKPSKWYLIDFQSVIYTPWLARKRWQGMVVDESARLRNPTAKVSRIITSNFTDVPKKAILAGIPAPKSPLDYFQQFKFLYGSFLGFTNFYQFRYKYFWNFNHKWTLKARYKNMFRDYVRNNSFILSSKGAGMGSKTIRIIRALEMSMTQRKLYSEVQKNYILEFKGQEKYTKYSVVAWGWMQQITGGLVNKKLEFFNKANELYTLLDTELVDKKVVVWFKYNEELLQVFESLPKSVTATYITGADNLARRSYKLMRWKQDEQRVLFIQQQIGQYSLDLSVASTAIYYSNTPDWEVRAQSEKRIANGIKDEPLLIIDLICRDSIDEDIKDIHAMRKKVSNYILAKKFMQKAKERNHVSIY